MKYKDYILGLKYEEYKQTVNNTLTKEHCVTNTNIGNMEKYSNYFLMDEQNIKEYAVFKLDFFNNVDDLEVIEIGDGNLNYVFRVKDNKLNKSVIIKQAGEELRISSDMKLPISRGKHEYSTYIEMYKLVPNMVPKIYFYDDVMCVIAMEDMKEYKVMRNALLEQNIYEKFAEQITDYLASLLHTTDILDAEHKKQNVIKFDNPYLCKITEDLVFTYSYFESNKTNIITENNKTFIKENVFNDKRLKLEVGKLKYKFINCPQALIHGDLHTGSIFVNHNDTCIFDPEFSFYGPIGYDVGNVIANLIFALLSNFSKKNIVNDEFSVWILNTIEAIIDLYIRKFNNICEKASGDDMFTQNYFEEYLLKDILTDTAGYTGTEIIRRIVGMAKNKDFTIINDLEIRSKMEQVGILIAKELIINREVYTKGKCYKELIINILQRQCKRSTK